MKVLYKSDKHWLFLYREGNMSILKHGEEEIARGCLGDEESMFRVKHIYNGLVDLHNVTDSDHRRGINSFVLESD